MQKHVPVLLESILSRIPLKAGDLVLDATFGAGGYSKRLIELGCQVYALDRDPTTKVYADAINSPLFMYNNGKFSDIASVFKNIKFDSAIFDLGISSMQVDTPSRGFSFRANGPLDMRMDIANDSLTAAEIINWYSESQLTDLFLKYGEEVYANLIARNIVKQRTQSPIKTTLQLADIIHKSIPKRRHSESHPATRVFQALRIEVNNELSELQKGLSQAYNQLKEDAYMAVVSFQCLEDQIAKNFMQERFCEFSGKPILPSVEEIRCNPRSRSAKLRFGHKLNV